MSYLLENSQVISKAEYLEDESKFDGLHVYPIGENYIVTPNDKPFFSIYDIANFCKKKYSDDKLFVIGHRFFDKLADDFITEFYIFNTVNIFEKSLTSYIKVIESELAQKQMIVQNNINIALRLLNATNIHIILGDNVKEHEVVSYILNPLTSDSKVFFSTESSNMGYKRPGNIRSSRISTILNSVRVLEPRDSKIKKYFVIALIVLSSLYLGEDVANMAFEPFNQDIQSETTQLESKLSQLRQNIDPKIAKNSELEIKINELKQKQMYQPQVGNNENITN